MFYMFFGFVLFCFFVFTILADEALLFVPPLLLMLNCGLDHFSVCQTKGGTIREGCARGARGGDSAAREERGEPGAARPRQQRPPPPQNTTIVIELNASRAPFVSSPHGCALLRLLAPGQPEPRQPDA